MKSGSGEGIESTRKQEVDFDLPGVLFSTPSAIHLMQSLNLVCAARRRACEVLRCSRSEERRDCNWESCGVGMVVMSRVCCCCCCEGCVDIVFCGMVGELVDRFDHRERLV